MPRHLLVLGAGSVGKRHMRNFVQLGCRVSAMDPRVDRLSEAEAEVPLSGRYSSLDEAQAAFPELDGVVVGSPTAYHVDQSIAALESGLPVYLEKPVSLSLTEALRLQNIPSRPDYEVPGAAAYDHVATRPDVDTRRVAVMAYSMGGYYAPRVAAFEKRYAACIAWGGHYDYHATWVTRRKILESGGNRVSAPHFQLPWVMGMPDMDSAMKKTEAYKLEGVANKITCPFLVTHGAEDSISPVANAQLLYDAVSSEKKTLKIFTAEEGGAEHCQGDNRFLGATYVADWIAANL